MGYLSEKNIINGREGTVFGTINGNVEEMAYVKKIELTAEVKKTDIPVLGKRTVSQKPSSIKYTGKMTIYYMTPIFRNIIIDYQNSGKMTYFDIMITNADPSSATGAQVMIAKNCCLDGLVMSKLDIESEQLDEEVSFTYDRMENPTKFNKV